MNEQGTIVNEGWLPTCVELIILCFNILIINELINTLKYIIINELIIMYFNVLIINELIILYFNLLIING